MSQIIQLRGDTAANWTSVNPILAAREMAVETDTQSYKIGDGVTAWNLLPYKGLQPVLGTTTLEAQAVEPSTPAAGFMRLYAKSIAGKIIPKFKGPSGLNSPIQSALWSNGVYFVGPGATTVPTVFGGAAMTAVGTVSHPALTSVNSVTSMSRMIVTSAATANAIAELRTPATRFWRGNSAGRGGFFHRTIFTTESVTALQRGFIGFNATGGATATTQSPSAQLNMVGIGWDSADTNLQIMSANASTGMKIDLGSLFPANNANNVYEFTLFCPPNESYIKWQIVNLITGDRAEGTITTNLPSAATFLAYHAFINNGGTAAAVIMGLKIMYFETDL